MRHLFLLNRFRRNLQTIFAFLFFPENSEGIKPTVGTVTESVYASGIIKADNQYILLHRKWYFTKK
jgi:hypothetical protein